MKLALFGAPTYRRVVVQVFVRSVAGLEVLRRQSWTLNLESRI